MMQLSIALILCIFLALRLEYDSLVLLLLWPFAEVYAREIPKGKAQS